MIALPTRALRTGLLLFLILNSAAIAAPAAETSARKYSLPEHGSFQMNVPASWTDQTSQSAQGMPPTIAFHPREGQPFEVLVTPIWRAGSDVPAPTKESIRKGVQKAADDAKSEAVEKTIPVVNLSGTAGSGYYFSVTDKAPKPGEFKFMTQGTLVVNDLTVAFTILTNDGQRKVVRDAMTMLRSAVHSNGE